MLDIQSGEIVWLKQVGSFGDDRIAHGGGITSDKNGNAVVYGDTTREFYRHRNGNKDPSFRNIFLSVFDQADGARMPPFTLQNGLSLKIPTFRIPSILHLL